MTSIADVVFTKMRPMTFYRPKDLAEEAKIKKECVSAALREIARGGQLNASSMVGAWFTSPSSMRCSKSV